MANFRRFSPDASIEIGPGATIVVAPNGSGKTSLFEAIEFGLTGLVARAGQDATALVRAGETDAFVTLEFDEGSRKTVRFNATMSQVEGNLEAVVGMVPTEDVRFLLRLTHLFEQGTPQWLVTASTADAGARLGVLPAGRDAVKASEAIPGTRTAIGMLHRQAVDRLGVASRELQSWQDLLTERNALRVALTRNTRSAVEVGGELESIARQLGLSLTLEAQAAVLQQGVGRLNAVLADRLRRSASQLAALRGAKESVEEYLQSVVRHGLAATEESEARLAVDSAKSRLKDAELATGSARTHANQVSRRLNVLEEVFLRRQDVGSATPTIAMLTRRVPSTSVVEEAIAKASQLESLWRTHEDITRQLESNDVRRLKVRDAMSEAAKETALPSELHRLRQDLIEAERRRAKASATEHELRQALSETHARWQGLIEALSVAKENADAVRMAIATIIEHTPRDASHCPACGAAYEDGSLVQRLLASVAANDTRLLRAVEAAKTEETTLESLRGQLSATQTELGSSEHAAATLVAAISKTETELLGLAALVDKHNAEIVQLESDRSALVARLLLVAPRPTEDERLGARVEAERLQELRRESVASVERAEASLRDAELRLATAHALASQEAIEIPESLSAANISELRSAAASATAEFQKCHNLENQIRREIEPLQRKLSDRSGERLRFEQNLRRLERQWSQLQLPGTPDLDALATHEAAETASQSSLLRAQERLGLLTSDVAAIAERTLGDEAQARVDQVRKEQSEDAMSERLLQERHAARTALDRLDRTREALETLHKSLAQVLQDGNELVSAPLLPRWRGILRRVVREERFRDVHLHFGAKRLIEHAETTLELNGQQVRVASMASEAQAVDVQLTFQLAMSLQHPWSPWRALLLDDPTQHHDVVHASAVFDVLREHIVDHGFQVVLATHDSVHADFLRRKLLNDGVPVRLWTLQAAANGVRPVPIG